MPIVWDAPMDRAFLLAIIKTNKVSVDYEAVSREMSTAAKPVTVSALQNRFAKLKKAAKEETGDSAEALAATPAKRKRGAKVSTTSAKKARTSAKKNDDQAEDAGSEGDGGGDGDGEGSEGSGRIKDEPNFDD